MTSDNANIEEIRQNPNDYMKNPLFIDVDNWINFEKDDLVCANNHEFEKPEKYIYKDGETINVGFWKVTYKAKNN